MAFSYKSKKNYKTYYLYDPEIIISPHECEANYTAEEWYKEIYRINSVMDKEKEHHMFLSYNPIKLSPSEYQTTGYFFSSDSRNESPADKLPDDLEIYETKDGLPRIRHKIQ